MKVGILGSRSVARTLAAKVSELGHEVMLGTRDPAALLAETQPDRMGNAPFPEWHKKNDNTKVGTFAQVAAFGELLMNATNGAGSLQALELAGSQNMNGKVLLDISNPLDFSRGMPPSLFVCNTDSLAEQIQRVFPNVRVVKSLNTVTAALMVNPGLVHGNHAVFVSGDDVEAKAQVTQVLKQWFGWKTVIDLGGLATARNVEMLLPLWVNLMMVQGTPVFNFQISK